MPCDCEVQFPEGRALHLYSCEYWQNNSSVGHKNGHQTDKDTKHDGHKMERDANKGHSVHHPHRKVYDEDEMDIEYQEVARELVRLVFFFAVTEMWQLYGYYEIRTHGYVSISKLNTTSKNTLRYWW